MTGHRRVVSLFLAGLTLGVASCSREEASSPAGASVRPGGALVVSTHGEPRTFNRLAARDRTSLLIATFTQAKLVRINLVTQEVEPWLAERWTRSADGLTYTLTLRPGLTFSDGHPLTADDVLFSFEAAYDEKANSPLHDALQVGGKNLNVTAPDPRTIVVTFPQPFAPNVRILDNLPILPRHKLQAALAAGTFASAWGVTTPPAELAGLGPFVVSQYTPGQRLVLARNPHYWRKDATGAALPYLDRVTFEVIPDQDTEILRLQSGEIDSMVSELRPEDYAPLKRAADAGKVKLLDLGVAYDGDMLWFNLKPGVFAKDPRAAWLQRDELRRAISMAVDRDVFANVVYFGAAVPVFGPITPANKKWYAPDLARPAHDPAGAKVLLATIGLTDKNGDGMLEDARNQPARFTLITQKGVTSRERGCAVIRDELKKIGLAVDVVPVDLSALQERIVTAKYDATYFGITSTDTDPAINGDLWYSRGGAHFWNIDQKTPATAWERRIDELMAQQSASPDAGERKRLFDEIQRIFAEHDPAVYFVAPRVYVVWASRVINVNPSAIFPRVLWTPDSIAVVH